MYSCIVLSAKPMRYDNVGVNAALLSYCPAPLDTMHR